MNSENLIDVIRKTADDLNNSANHDKDDEGCQGLKDKTVQLIGALRSALYPEVFGKDNNERKEPNCAISNLEEAYNLLKEIITRVDPDSDYDCVAKALFNELPLIRSTLEGDLMAAYTGDPAATSVKEVMLSYPAFEAISIYRIAHKLYSLKVKILPRMMSEYAHMITGIDIHPGAIIGKNFFIDHGTGVVIGETTTIGNNVKLYQGVTLGAKSFEVAPDGSLVKGIKRHPDIGNFVVIYADATILGGETKIGDHAVIGGNVWLTHSVPANATVLSTSIKEEK